MSILVCIKIYSLIFSIYKTNPRIDVNVHSVMY